jgi:hypothetical protein
VLCRRELFYIPFAEIVCQKHSSGPLSAFAVSRAPWLTRKVRVLILIQTPVVTRRKPKPYEKAAIMRIVIHYILAVVILTVYGGQV